MHKSFMHKSSIAILLVFALVLGAWAGTLEKLRLAEPSAADAQLATLGITNAADRASIANAGFSADAFVAAAVRERGTKQLWTWLQTVPADLRTPFVPVLSNSASLLFPATPVFGALYMRAVITGRPINAPVGGASVQELITCLLAPEIIQPAQVAMCKSAVRDRAAQLARWQLRNMSPPPPASSNGVGTVSTMIEPVAAALNAPMCLGAEPALRALGATCANVDRTAVSALVTAWTNDAINGVSSPGQVSLEVGKISVVLGVEAYNEWAVLYNKGN